MHRYLMVLVLSGVCACDGDDGDGGGGTSGGGAGTGGFANQTCDTLSACGGDVEGVWTVEDLCVADAARIAGMSNDEPECEDLFVGAHTDGTGTATFSDGDASSSIVMTMDLHAVWTPACLSAVSGLQSVDIERTCTSLDREYAENPKFTGASCMIVAGNCDCIVSAESTLVLGSMYTLAGTQITFAGDSGPTDYCVRGDRLQMSAMMGGERMLLTLTR
jgi:hypothetical protein